MNTPTYPHSSLQRRLDYHSIPEPNSGCYLWMATLNQGGYGLIWKDGRLAMAHRVAWELEHGPIPDGLFVCHKCDVRACINHRNLFLGDAFDNMRDMAKKGRAVFHYGAANGQTKLSPAQVTAIRRDGRSTQNIR